MADKILVTYATRSGATAEVAEVIGKALLEHNVAVEIQRVQDVDDLTPYNAIVIGSAIRYDRWLPEAMQFVKQHHDELLQMRVATFLTCLALGIAKGERYESARRKAHDVWMRPVRDLVNPVSQGLFAGALNPDRVPELPYRLAFWVPILLGLLKGGDYRDWDEIRQWAGDLPSKLLQ